MTIQFFFMGGLFAFILIYLIVVGARKDTRFLSLIAFLIPLQSLSIDIGILVTWYKLIFPVAIIALFVGRKSFRDSIPGMRFLLLFLVYSSILTISKAFIDYSLNQTYLEGSALGWGIAQTNMRYWIQLGTTFFTWGIALIPVWFIVSSEDLKSVINGYVNGNLFSITVGFYQVVAQRFNLPGANVDFFFGVNKGSFLDHNLGLYRLSGLGGEPKHTAAFAISAIIILLVILLFSKDQLGIGFIKLKTILLLLGVGLSLSSGAYIALSAVIIYFIFAALFKRPNKVIGYSFFVGSVLFLIIGLFGHQSIVDLLEVRLVNRVMIIFDGQGEKYEPKDTAALRYYSEHPESIILGEGAGGLDFKIIPYVPLNYLNQGGTVTPAYFFVRFIGEFGLIGFLIVLGLWRSWYLAISRRINYDWGRYFLIASIFGIAATSSVSLSGYLLIASSIVVAVNKDCNPVCKG